MKVVNRAIGTIRPYGNNPRHNDNAVGAVANSIKEFGWQQPIVVDKDGVIIAGHTRFKAAKDLGLDEVPVVIADGLTDEQIRAYRLADNKSGELAEWDFELLDRELGDIFDIDMSAFGFVDEIEMDNEEPEIKLNESISVVIDCESNEEAEEIYNALTEEGYVCRVSTL